MLAVHLLRPQNVCSQSYQKQAHRKENLSKSWTTGPLVRIGPVRYPDYWSEILFGPVGGPDIGPDFCLVWYVVRNSEHSIKNILN